VHQLPPELYLYLQSMETARHLDYRERHRIADARRRADLDRRELERAWRALDKALAAESRSRRELLALTQ
jgi:hypothetical protein